jgi:hypothetical protein
MGMGQEKVGAKLRRGTALTFDRSWAEVDLESVNYGVSLDP